jgi:hypothetical protein
VEGPGGGEAAPPGAGHRHRPRSHPPPRIHRTTVDGPVTLTAPAALTFDDLADTASGLTGRTIERVVVDGEQGVADHTASGVSEKMARSMPAWFQAARAGDVARSDPLLSELLGREPRGAAEQVADHIAARTTAAEPSRNRTRGIRACDAA